MKKTNIIPTLWYYTYRSLIEIALFFYFKKVKIYGKHHIPQKGAILFICNHQNALLDPLLVGTSCGKKTYFLARSDVFRNAIIAKILRSLRMMPVFRIRDGRHSLKNNDATFDTSVSLLLEKKQILIFPEGSHKLKRAVRPLSKGFTRIVFKALKKNPNLHLQIIPVGVSYQQATKFPDNVSVHYGAAIDARAYWDEEQPRNATLQLKEACSNSLKELTVHLEDSSYQSQLESLEGKNADFTAVREIHKYLKDPNSGLPVSNSKIYWIAHAIRYVRKICFFPLELIWHFKVFPKIKEREFISTLRFGFGKGYVPIQLIGVCAILSKTMGWETALVYFAAHILLLYVHKRWC